ncbi:MAG: hypothetical protein WC132_04430, partial [Methanomethylophilus sp.]
AEGHLSDLKKLAIGAEADLGWPTTGNRDCGIFSDEKDDFVAGNRIQQDWGKDRLLPGKQVLPCPRRCITSRRGNGRIR